VKFIFGFVVGVVVVVGIPLLVLATGTFDVAATSGPGALEKTVAGWAMDRSVDRHAKDLTNPYTGQAEAAKKGLDHYAETCVLCHGAPGVEPAELAKGLNPPVPKLLDAAENMSDGQIFWIISHGIRMTGMPAFAPTHTEDEIWDIVTFVRRLPNLTPQEKATLSAATSKGDELHRHGEGGEGEEPGKGSTPEPHD
jgi:mono/diheme cytochrome c family protein